MITSSGQGPTYVGLLGWPVGHSRSPAMHRAAFEAHGLDWEYLLLPVPPERVREAVWGLRALGFAGANVTVPHKQAVMEVLDEVTAEAQAIGAVNTILHRTGKLIGHNTDAQGFLRALREAQFEPRGCQAIVLGAGGAGRAVLYALLTEGATVTLVNRTVERAHSLAARFEATFQRPIAVLSFEQFAAQQSVLNEATILVNSTRLGMTPAAEESPLPDTLELPPHLTVCDLVYSPLETRLLASARAGGAPTIDGLGMLVQQGAAAFSLWTGHAAPLEVMRAAVRGGT